MNIRKISLTLAKILEVLAELNEDEVRTILRMLKGLPIPNTSRMTSDEEELVERMQERYR